jgi:hypothetical protein
MRLPTFVAITTSRRPGAERRAEHLLRAPLGVGVGRVEEVHAGVERAGDEVVSRPCWSTL